MLYSNACLLKHLLGQRLANLGPAIAQIDCEYGGRGWTLDGTYAVLSLIRTDILLRSLPKVVIADCNMSMSSWDHLLAREDCQFNMRKYAGDIEGTYELFSL